MPTAPQFTPVPLHTPLPIRTPLPLFTPAPRAADPAAALPRLDRENSPAAIPRPTSHAVNLGVVWMLLWASVAGLVFYYAFFRAAAWAWGLLRALFSA